MTNLRLDLIPPEGEEHWSVWARGSDIRAIRALIADGLCEDTGHSFGARGSEYKLYKMDRTYYRATAKGLAAVAAAKEKHDAC